MSAEGSQESAEQQGPGGENAESLESSSAGSGPSLEGESVWQRLKSMGGQQDNVGTLPCHLSSEIRILSMP